MVCQRQAAPGWLTWHLSAASSAPLLSLPCARASHVLCCRCTVVPPLRAAEDVERTREVYRACLKLLPHKAFTFGKVWIMAAQFEIRQLRLDAARKILGMSIGMCPKVRGGVGGVGGGA